MSSPVTLSLFDQIGLAAEPGDPTAADIRWWLQRRYSQGWATFPEFALKAENYGRTHGKWRYQSIIDLLAVNYYSTSSFRVEAVEIKVARSDFLAEMKDPGKRAPAEAVSNACWFAVAENVCEPHEVPDPWGLYIYSNTGRLKRAKIAQRRTVDLPPWFIGHLARRAAPMNRHQQWVRDALRMARAYLRLAKDDPARNGSVIRRAEDLLRALQRPEDRKD